jgi:hypothetical protein
MVLLPCRRSAVRAVARLVWPRLISCLRLARNKLGAIEVAVVATVYDFLQTGAPSRHQDTDAMREDMRS